MISQASAEQRHRWLPFGDHSRPRRLAKVLAWLGAVVVALAVLQLLGVDVAGWFSDLWDALNGIGLGYLVAGWTLQTIQTTLTAFGWYSILRFAFPDGRVAYLQILAAYATGVALNGFLPANIGTVVMLLMFVAIIPGANLPGVLGGDGRAEDLLQPRGDVRLRLPVRCRCRARWSVSSPRRTITRCCSLALDRRRRRCSSSSSAGSSGASCRGCGRRPCRAARSSRARASTPCGWRCRRSARGWPSSA